MVDLLLTEDDHALRKPGVVRTLFDPACGTGGMLAVAEERLIEMNANAHLEVYGQELNDESYAICRSDMMLKGQQSENIKNGNSFSDDQFKGQRFDYLLANPPFGVEWKKVQKHVKDEAKNLGFQGRFGAGLPRINDGSLLFLQHMISKMKTPEEGGSRLAIVFNGSPLFTGAAGSGESEIRRWIIENDWLEAVVALPDQLFYNTGISTYFWIVTNRKAPERRGKVQLVDAREMWAKMNARVSARSASGSATIRYRRDREAVRRLRGGRPGQDPPERVVRLPAHHRRTAAPRRRRQDRHRPQGQPQARRTTPRPGERATARRHARVGAERRQDLWPNRATRR